MNMKLKQILLLGSLAVLLVGTVLFPNPEAQALSYSYAAGSACAGVDDTARAAFDFNTNGVVNTSATRRQVQCPVFFRDGHTDRDFGYARIFLIDNSSTEAVTCELKVRTPSGSVYYTGQVSSTGGLQSMTTADMPGNRVTPATAFVWCGVPPINGSATSSILGVKIHNDLDL